MNTPVSEHIVVGVDGSLAARAAARWAIDYAGAGDTVELVYAWSPSPTASDVGLVDADDDRAAQQVVRHEVAHVRSLARARGVLVTGQALRGDPRELLSYSGADLVVVGADSRRALARVLVPSVRAHLVHHGTTPVVIVPFHRTLSARGDAESPTLL